MPEVGFERIHRTAETSQEICGIIPLSCDKALTSSADKAGEFSKAPLIRNFTEVAMNRKWVDACS